ncbi:hypothetical protein BV25DRAFT_1826407 [Artomyces pyxidatus]|uniref:Uncharacterized protein n=1 Tax=Artomyces pyxidatus TaxID=48021 RepID=A0ACB8T107_9AGAM|nr:hypothetical protein BV25DRAFT_1826407 [Artomyces pyxidatus]
MLSLTPCIHSAWASLELQERSRDVHEHTLLADTLSRSISGPITTVHTSFTPDPLPTLHAPVTEFVWLTPNANTHMETFSAALERLSAYGNDPSSPTIGTSYALAQEKPETFLVAMGWSTVDVSLRIFEHPSYSCSFER